MPKRTHGYDEWLYEQLTDPTFAAEYLNRDSLPRFFLSLIGDSFSEYHPVYLQLRQLAEEFPDIRLLKGPKWMAEEPLFGMLFLNPVGSTCSLPDSNSLVTFHSFSKRSLNFKGSIWSGQTDATNKVVLKFRSESLNLAWATSPWIIVQSIGEALSSYSHFGHSGGQFGPEP